MEEIDLLVRSRYPVLYVLTHEEGRLESLLFRLARRQAKQLFTWTATRGLALVDDQAGGRTAERESLNDPSELLNHIAGREASAIFLLRDFHPFLDDPQVVRQLRDVAGDLKNSFKSIVLCCPRLNMPAELEKEITLIDFPLPDAQELMDLLGSVCRALAQKNPGAVQLGKPEALALVRAAQGLTLFEAENAFAQAAVTGGVIDGADVDLVLREKQQVIRKSGILEFYATDAGLADVGGLDLLKAWLRVRGKAFGPRARAFGLEAPKGVLLLGAPGCGKSLTAKAIGQSWGLPLLRLDLGRIFSGLVGSSEENMRKALKVAEGVAPAVLWVDEMEKGLAGGTSGASDGGTASRVFGTLLTWMQEKTATVFVVATANRVDLLPPELLRRGRFDEIFFVDLPSASSRAGILSIHLTKRGRDPQPFDLTAVAAATSGFSGAELEQCVIEALFAAFDEERDITTEDLLAAARATIPLSVSSAEALRRSREWAAQRTRRAEAADEAPGAATAGAGAARADFFEVDPHER
jgi:AAA+ superfamily predicted ATPase